MKFCSGQFILKHLLNVSNINFTFLWFLRIFKVFGERKFFTECISYVFGSGINTLNECLFIVVLKGKNYFSVSLEPITEKWLLII